MARLDYEESKAYNQRWRKALRREVIEAYGGKCARCHESGFEFLVIDHIDGQGSGHRKAVGRAIYYWLKKNGWPEGFRVLCYNCNNSFGMYGYCPHG